LIGHVCDVYTCKFFPSGMVVLYKTLCDKVCQWLETGQWFSPGTAVSSTNKLDLHNITEILLKVVMVIYKCQKKLFVEGIGNKWVCHYIVHEDSRHWQAILTFKVLSIITIIYNFSLLEETDHLKEKDKGNIQNYFSIIITV
jgi:hypothetical protein